MKILLITLFITGLLFSSGIALADNKISLGVKLFGAGWTGDNGAGSADFDSDKGGQLGFNAAFSSGKFYTGLNLQGGQYTFKDTAPDQFTGSGRVAAGGGNIKQHDFDLLFGYYFWPQVSLFADIKAVKNTWLSNNYEQAFSGLGLGVSAFNPVNENWTFFGSFGFVASGDIKDNNDSKVGEGDSTALVLGAVYRLDDKNNFNVGIKFRNYEFKHLDNTSQEYSVNAIFAGFTHTFLIK